MDYCIITVENNAPIVEYLKESGFSDKQWILWDDYLEECKKKALLFEKAILNSRSKSQLSTLLKIYNMLEQDSSNNLWSAKKSEIIATLEWYYGRDIEAAQSFDDNHLKLEVIRRNIKTIGIVIAFFERNNI